MITFNCDGCSATFKVPDDKAGKRGKCPRCGAVVSVPSPQAQRSRDPVSHPAIQPSSPEPPSRPLPKIGSRFFELLWERRNFTVLLVLLFVAAVIGFIINENYAGLIDKGFGEREFNELRGLDEFGLRENKEERKWAVHRIKRFWAMMRSGDMTDEELEKSRRDGVKIDDILHEAVKEKESRIDWGMKIFRLGKWVGLALLVGILLAFLRQCRFGCGRRESVH